MIIANNFVNYYYQLIYMKILSPQQIRATDQYTIKHEPIKSIDLMERASEAFVVSFVNKFNSSHKVHIISGTGNNGGDGMAIGRLLFEKGYEISASVVNPTAGRSEDFQINFELLQRDIEINEVDILEDLPSFEDNCVIVDAIFGSGLTRPVEGIYADVIQSLNHSSCKIVSVDISSGLFSDKPQEDHIAIKPDHTISFQLPKLAFLIPENDDYVGNWEIVDIMLDQDYISRQTTQHIYLTESFVKPLIKPRKSHSHKGDFGKGLLISGSYGKMGAAVMAGVAFMRSGAGLLTYYIPKSGYEIVQTSVPEAMVVVSPDEFRIENIPDLGNFDAIGVGPGIGTEKVTVESLNRLLQLTEDPIVIDADALNILAKNRHLLSLIPEHSILTPHPKEFERLTDKADNGYHRLKKLRDFAQKIKSYVILKGGNTAIATPEGIIYFNSTGNPGMATGGSGDVLTGIITSLLAQHQSPYHAAVMGVYIHGLAGDLGAEDLGYESLIATDIISYLPYAFGKFHRN